MQSPLLMWNTQEANKKRDKRCAENGISLELYVRKTRESLEKQIADAHKLREEAAALRADAAKITQKWLLRFKHEALSRARALEEEAEKRKSGTYMRNFDTKSAAYLKAHYKRVVSSSNKAPRTVTVPGVRHNIDGYVSHIDNSRQEALMNEFLSDIENKPPKMAIETRDICPMCNDAMTLMATKSIMTCTSCGYVVSYLDATSSSMSYSDDVEFACFSYKRINHFNEWLQQVQAKETSDVSDEIIQKVMDELYARRIKNIHEINAKLIREILKSLRLRKTYEHVVQLTSKLTGKPAFIIPPEAEEMCRLMFIAVQPAFDKHCPKDRKNFLSYAYCLYKFFQLLGYDELLDTFTLLKGRDKLQRQDQIFEKICKELDWDFVPSI